MIEVKNLEKRYGDHVAIRDIRFSVDKGEILAFLGPNGAGKTTTMRILAGAIPATRGTAIVAGFDIFDQPMQVKRRIGYLPENLPLYPDLTVTEYLNFVGKIKGLHGTALKTGLGSVLEKCGLADVSKRLIANLSRGYRQRVGLAQALIHNPEVLILDEPTVGLDPKQIIEIRTLIKNLRGEHTIILCTHILPEATAVCDKVVIINKGQIMAVDSQERLSAQVRSSERISFTIRQKERFSPEKILGIEGVLQLIPDTEHPGTFVVETKSGSDVREEVAKIIIENGLGLLELKSLTVSLEEVFLHLTTEEVAPATAVIPEDAA
ncbi:MAG: ATP-binding cassette domain-containing protein [Nitrospirae bacterium]|nr:ATP-binding cassette domain-containing protein [Candidatus Troglogloeales bacterium]